MLAFDVSLNILEFDKFVKKVEKWTGKLVGGFGHVILTYIKIKLNINI